jgi:hypothetical protein
MLNVGKRNALRRNNLRDRLGVQHPNDIAQAPVPPTCVRALFNKNNTKIIMIEFIGKHPIECPAILDSGSDRSLVPKHIVNRLGRNESCVIKRLAEPLELVLGDGATHLSATSYVEADIRLKMPSGHVIAAKQQLIIWDVPSAEVILGANLLEDLGVDPGRILDQLVHDQGTQPALGGTSGQSAGTRSNNASNSQSRMNKDNLYSNTEQSSPDPADWDDEVLIGDDTHEEIWEAMKGMFERALKNGLPKAYHKRLWELIVAKRKVWRVKLSRDAPVKVEPFFTEKVPGALPVRCAQRSYRKDQSEFMNEFVTTLLENGMIRENPNSKWASPAVVVRKPNGSYRMVVDLRKVNALSIKTAWPMPMLDEIISHLERSKYWFILDAFKGFWLMPLAQACQEMMSFMTDRGVYTPTRSMQGATNSAPQFQARMGIMFKDLLWHKLIVWMTSWVMPMTLSGGSRSSQRS